MSDVVRWRDGEPHSTWTSSKLAFLECKNVCARCNSGWMSDLEAGTKPLLLRLFDDGPVVLGPSDQLQLAAWAALKATVHDGAGPHPRVVSRDQRLILKEQERPPANMRVSLAATVIHDFGLERAQFASPRQGGETRAATFATTIWMDGVVLRVVANDLLDSAQPVAAAARSGFRSQDLFPPVQNGHIWPPAQPLDRSELHEFARAPVPVPEVKLDPATYPADEATR